VKDLFSLRHGLVDDPALEFRAAPSRSEATLMATGRPT